MSDSIVVWSYGGGVQTSAIAALVVLGRLPAPAYTAIVDTNRELSSTWEYLEAVTAPALLAVGCKVHRIDKRDFATGDLYGGAEGKTLRIPAFTTQNGEVGKLSGFCSNEWKRRVLERWMKTNGHAKYDSWIGYSTDEIDRCQKPDKNRPQKYPLIEARMNRGDCIALVERMGWPTPPRSSCWMCPNHTQEEWRDIKENHKEDWAKAIVFEKHIQKTDPHAWLHGDGKPLGECDITDQNESMFTRCDSGMCFV